MNKEALNPYQAHGERINFIEKAVAEGVLDRIPVKERSQNIALVYYLNEELTGEKVGIAFPQSSGIPLGKESVRQKGKKFLTAAYNTASPQLQAKHPLSELLARKLSPLKEVSTRIKGIVERGANPATIKNMVSTASLQSARITLRRRGVEIPFIRTAYEDVKAEVEAETDYKKLKEVLASFSDKSLSGHLFRHSKDIDKVFSTLYIIVKSAGFHLHRKYINLFAKAIEKDNIPIRKTLIEKQSKKKGKTILTCYVVFAKHEKPIIETLERDPDLQRFKENPVKLFCGENDGDLPNTTELHKKNKYGHVFRLVENVLHTRSNRSITIRYVLDGCPLRVFKYRKNYFYPLENQQELVAFLESKRSTFPNRP